MRPPIQRILPSSISQRTEASSTHNVFTMRMGPFSSTPTLRIVMSKKTVRTAVSRNLLRRRTREYIRTNIAGSMPKRDVTIVLHKGVAELTHKEFYKELERVIKRVTRNA